MRVGDTQKLDSKYFRKGTGSIFVFTEPLTGYCYVHVREHRTAVDWGVEIEYLLTECYPDKEKIILVMDNLNLHAVSSLYRKFPATKARAYAKRLEIHYTPKHGSWLNIAEIELNVMTRQCLSRRLNSLNLYIKGTGMLEQRQEQCDSQSQMAVYCRKCDNQINIYLSKI